MKNGYSEYSGERRAGLKWALWGMFALFALSGVGCVLGTFGNIASTPSRVINKTLETDNIISNYEFFHDANNQVKARVAQIRGHKGIVADNADQGERARLRIELAAMQQSCRDLVGKYNANATKTNRSIFMGREAPDNLNPTICE